MGQQAPPLQSQPMPSQPPNPNTAQAQQSGGELSLNLRGPPRGTSAPSSPAKSRESLLQRVQSLTGAARDQGASILGAAVQSATRPSFNKDRSFTLLVIDDQNTDWSKYFRGKKLHNDYDIRVEQAEFKELSLIASGEQGCTVSMAVYRSGTKVMRSFRPDFVLIRQNLRDASEDNRSLLLGLKYGGVPSVNSLSSIYNFQDRPWVFAHLMQLQRRLGRENFPLIEQTYYPNHREMGDYGTAMPVDHLSFDRRSSRIWIALKSLALFIEGISSPVAGDPSRDLVLAPNADAIVALAVAAQEVPLARIEGEAVALVRCAHQGLDLTN
ncbi:synapsin-like [Ctenocephalides felis]|uniref:synapsin-like n=1 Tax=Ctenocephalides felis TaxID=7515 RepID=UPI000E6E1686|nr:synapsin-like [Ctenocephalides felis]